MKVSTKTMAFLGLSGLSTGYAQSQYCPMTTKVTCTLGSDYDDANCNTLEQQQTCGNHNLYYTFQYCNEQQKEVKLNPSLVVAKVNNDVIGITEMDLNRNVPMPYGCRTYEPIVRTINTCQKASTHMSLKIEGNRLDNNGEEMKAQGNYCYSFAYLSSKVRAQEATIPEPEPFPEPEPEPDLGTAPDISMAIECKYRDTTGKFNQECSTFQDDLSCEQEVQFWYRVTNNGNNDVSLLAIVDENSENLFDEDELIKGVTLLANDNYYTTTTTNINLCEEAGQTITKKGTASASSDAPFGAHIRTVSDKYELTLPTTEVNYEFISPEVTCMYQGKKCVRTDICFSGEVDISYKVQNVGNTCHTIERVSVDFDQSETHYLGIDGKDNCDETRSCPYDIFTFTEKRVMNFCDDIPADGAVPIEINIQTDADENNAFLQTHLLIDNDYPFAPVVSSSSEDYDSSESEDDNEGDGIICSTHPTQLWFTFIPNICSASNNDQEGEGWTRRRGLRHDSKKKKDKNNFDYGCVQYGTMFGDKAKVEIEITSLNLKKKYSIGSNLCKGTTFKIGDGTNEIDSDLMVTIYDGDGNLVQEMLMDVSCAGKNMATGHTFGSLKLSGLTVSDY